MRITHLALEDFRSYERADIELAPGVTALVGANGAGKTNVLEAIHLLARGTSPRARDDGEMVRWGATTARASARLRRDAIERSVGTVLFAPPPGERRRPRRHLVDGAPKRADDALGQIVVVAFFPEDVELLAQAPSARRRHLDGMVAQVEARHRSESREYQRVLEQRNALLRLMRDEGRIAGAELAFWDMELCRLGASISLRRARAVTEARELFALAMADFGAAGSWQMAYATAADGGTPEERAASYRRLVAEKRERELWQGATLVGPHREDLTVTADGRALPTFASRGEQRTAVLALKLAEARWLRERTGEIPIFLLDDVLSELDAERREALVRAIPEGAQALLTAALAAGIPPRIAEGASVVPVSPGKIGVAGAEPLR